MSGKRKNKNQRLSRRQERQLAKAKAQRKRRLAYGALIGGLILIVALLVWQTSQGQAQTIADIPDPVEGPDTAPVTILDFSDFGCPSCRAWHNAGIQKAIVERYGDQVQFVWKDFPVISAQSPLAAEAGQCANVQGKFWPYHDYIYEQGSALDRNSLSRYAQIVGLDVQAFDECLDGHQTRGKVSDNLKLARSFNLRGAPSFVVNGKVLPAPPDFNQLSAIIDNELAQQ